MQQSNNRELALCGVLCALSTVFLYLGGILPFAPYVCLILASTIYVVVRIECRPTYAWLCWLASAILAIILSPDKELAILFLFIGYYPLIKPHFDRIKLRMLRYLAKGGFFVFCITLAYLLLLFVITSEVLWDEFRSTELWLLIAVILLSLVLFYCYDILLERFYRLYIKRRRKKKN